MTHATRSFRLVVAVLAAFVLHIAVLAVLGSAVHAHGAATRAAADQGAPQELHERSRPSRQPLIDFTPPEVQRLSGLGDHENIFDVPEPVRSVVAFIAFFVEDTPAARPGCGGPIDLDRGRAPPQTEFTSA